MGRMDGKVVIITGAGTGVGRAAMQLFSREGAKVFGVSRTQANLDQTLALVKEGGGEGAVFAADLADDAACERVIKAALAKYGRVDSLVHAAGIGYNWAKTSPGTMADVAGTTPQAWREVMAIDLDAYFYMCRHVLPLFVAQGKGTIVSVSSIGGYMGMPDAHTYTAAKAGMINLTRSMCVTYASKGIRANCIAPGFIDTPMTADYMDLFKDPVVGDSITPMRRAGTPMEMAYGCLYFACDESGYCNGAVLTIDGGTTARM